MGIEKNIIRVYDTAKLTQNPPIILKLRRNREYELIRKEIKRNHKLGSYLIIPPSKNESTNTLVATIEVKGISDYLTELCEKLSWNLGFNVTKSSAEDNLKWVYRPK